MDYFKYLYAHALVPLPHLCVLGYFFENYQLLEESLVSVNVTLIYPSHILVIQVFIILNIRFVGFLKTKPSENFFVYQ